MQKQHLTILITLALFAAHHSSFAAQPKPPQPEKTETAHVREYTPEDRSFQILYPADWKVVTNGAAGAAVSFVNEASLKPGQPQESMTLVIVASKGATLEQFSDALKAKGNAKAGFKPVEDGAYTIGDWKTHRFVFDVKSGAVTTRAIQFVMVKDAFAYVMTFYMPPEKFDKAMEDRTFQLCGVFKVPAPKTAVVKPDKATPFDSKELGFSLAYPPSWTKQSLDQKGVALALARKASAGRVPQILMVLADTLDPDEKADLKEMEEKLVASTKGSLKDGKVLEATDSKLGGQPARRVILGGTRVADDHQGRVILLISIRDRATFGLMAGGPVEDFESVKGDVDKIIASFTFVKDKSK